MKTQVEKQQETVARMKQSPCQCLEYHPKLGTEIYAELLKEWQTWRNLPNKFKGTVSKDWILIHLIASQNCPYIQEEGKINE
jgi:hypothetical protein